MLKENLESGAHGAALPKREGLYDEFRRGGGLRNRDYAACPFATRRIRAVVLVSLPQSKWEGLQGGLGGSVREPMQLGFNTQFGEIKVLASRTGPIAWE